MNRPPLLRALLPPAALRATRTTIHGTRSGSSFVPRVAQPSFWKSLVPKFLRPSERDPWRPKAKKSRGWNPATFFIIIFLLIGSMSVRMIGMRQDFAAYMRRSDIRIGLLREVVEKLQRGEEVDVEGELGAGDLEKEAAWDNGLLRPSFLSRRC